jgi:alpha-ketoglutarate-dependent taurine dioxygenase
MATPFFEDVGAPTDTALTAGEQNGSMVTGSRLSPAGGVAIDGVDLSQPLTRAEVNLIRTAFLHHHVVVFRGQALSREQQFAFAANFGEVEHGAVHKDKAKRYGVAHVISNLDGDGKPVDRSASPVSNYNWHTDKPYYRVPPMMTALYAVETPARGGDTEFANTAMAYSTLAAEVQRRITGLRVVFYWGAGYRGAEPQITGSRILEAVDHPLVRTHPETGVKALYIGNHSSHVLGWPPAAGRALLDNLLAHATQPEFVYTHRWQPGDLIMWDNRCLLHRAVANFGVNQERRILHRTVVRGTVPF